MPGLAIFLAVISSDCCKWGCFKKWDLKVSLIWISILFAVTGAIYSGLQTNDSDACVSFRAAGILGTIFTTIGVILAAVTSSDRLSNQNKGGKKEVAQE